MTEEFPGSGRERADGSGPIDFYFDFLSPFGYLAATRIEDIGERFGRSVNWRPFLLGITVLQVMGLKPLMETPLKSDYSREDIPRMAQLLGVPVTMPDLSNINSLAASRAFYWQSERNSGMAKALALRLLRRLWVEGSDITKPSDIVEEASELGIDCDGLRSALADERVKTRLREAVDEAVGRKVFGSPFFIVDGQSLWGVDRLWMLEHWLENGCWDPA